MSDRTSSRRQPPKLIIDDASMASDHNRASPSARSADHDPMSGRVSPLKRRRAGDDEGDGGGDDSDEAMEDWHGATSSLSPVARRTRTLSIPKSPKRPQTESHQPDQTTVSLTIPESDRTEEFPRFSLHELSAEIEADSSPRVKEPVSPGRARSPRMSGAFTRPDLSPHSAARDTATKSSSDTQDAQRDVEMGNSEG